MLISYKWLRELTGTSLTPLELRERLTMVGLAIDAVEEKDGDSVLDVEVPSNRPDCLSHLGIAREVSVIEKSRVQRPKSIVFETKGKAGDFAGVEIRRRGFMSALRGPHNSGSEDWPISRMAGDPAQRNWTKTDQQRCRHHQLRPARNGPTASCIRSGKACRP